MSNGQQLSNDPFEQSLHRQLQEVIANVDDDTARELQQARRRALAHKKDRSKHAGSGVLGGLWQPVWTGVAATALVGVFAMWWAVNLNHQSDRTADLAMPVLDDDFDLMIALVDEDTLATETPEDLDFYAWLLQVDMDELEQFENLQMEGELG